MASGQPGSPEEVTYAEKAVERVVSALAAVGIRYLRPSSIFTALEGSDAPLVELMHALHDYIVICTFLRADARPLTFSGSGGPDGSGGSAAVETAYDLSPLWESYSHGHAVSWRDFLMFCEEELHKMGLPLRLTKPGVPSIKAAKSPASTDARAVAAGLLFAVLSQGDFQRECCRDFPPQKCRCPDSLSHELAAVLAKVPCREDGSSRGALLSRRTAAILHEVVQDIQRLYSDVQEAVGEAFRLVARSRKVSLAPPTQGSILESWEEAHKTFEALCRILRRALVECVVSSRSAGWETALVPERAGERYDREVERYGVQTGDSPSSPPPQLLPVLVPSVSPSSFAGGPDSSALDAVRAWQDERLVACRETAEACSRRMRSVGAVLSREMMRRRLEGIIREGIRRTNASEADEPLETDLESSKATESGRGQGRGGSRGIGKSLEHSQGLRSSRGPQGVRGTGAMEASEASKSAKAASPGEDISLPDSLREEIAQRVSRMSLDLTDIEFRRMLGAPVAEQGDSKLSFRETALGILKSDYGDRRARRSS